MAEITFTDAAIDDLRRIGPDAVSRVLKKLLLLAENPEAVYPLDLWAEYRSRPQ
ncbi:type II toxin-antitoxin system RelE family toxin [Nocardiopsis valliformis]|uniref:type II toxin-antitoxin system RelE family toxin n=1 Tax=Nocardiopsis valliformis TaxID=239974 RepID=UPI00034D7180|nr:hypothetical protein [Nocardiopsis valliformis]